ncbi:lamin tail domain-containing protein [Yeosuana sp. AK3]
MKKLYMLFFTILISGLSFGQASDLYFSMYGEGSSNNKWLEIYNGTGGDVDLSNYSVELYSNGAATATNTLTFTAGTMLVSGDVYVVYNSSSNASIIANGDVSSSVTFFNGDDAIALLKLGAVIDVFGQIGVDPGSSWTVGSTTGGTVNHTLIRKANICDPNPVAVSSFGTDDATSEWIVFASDAEWGQIGSHVGCSTDPTLILNNAPSDGSTTIGTPEDVNAAISFSTTNFSMSMDAGGGVSDNSGDGYIEWAVTNMGSPVDSGNIFTSNDGFEYPISGLIAGNTYLFFSELVDNSGASLIPAVTYSFTITIPAYNDVATIADLRAGTVDPDTYYRVTGEVINTYSRTSRNQKYFQDATGGILVDDALFEISTVYNEGDGITNIRGHLFDFNGVLEFVPTPADWGAATSTGNDVSSTIISISTLINNIETYESRLVRINGVTFESAGGIFATNTNTAISDGPNVLTDKMIFRPAFSEASYIGTTIPSGSNDMLVLVGEISGVPHVTARTLSELTLSTKNNQIQGFALYPNPTSLGYVTMASKNNAKMNVALFDILGKQVLNKTVSNNTLNVSSLKSGVYIMKVSQDNASVTKKLVIQ